MSSKAFLSIIAKRRSCYLLGADSTISVAQIQEIIQDTIIHVPSAFNSQTVRVVLLVGDEHRALWDITHEAVRGVAPAEVFPATEKKLKDFKAAYGTVSIWLIHSVTTSHPTTSGSVFRRPPDHQRIRR